MKINIFILVIISLFISCKSNKAIVETESQYFTDSMYSKSLLEYRKHNIYLPKGFNSKKNYPIVYATDGFTINENSFLKKSLDSLIENNLIKPIIFIESHCNTKIADSTSSTFADGRKVKLNFRNFEYVNNDSDTQELKHLSNRFKNHMFYFENELLISIEKKLYQKKLKKDRFFYGYSNGAGFGMELLNRNTELIGTYLCFSTFGGGIKTNTWKKEIKYPSLYMIYGSKEPDFLKEESQIMKKMYLDSNSFAEIRSFEGGHDYKIWNQELIKLLTKLFSINNK
ncbi:esterase [Flavobacterium sp. F372]|uniref:Esterase n=1 Tax=Flavobacterium bernardetii TaxID=2813823 RepID=A0ABR7J231_9FLAO|nr:alpha/beta hydrolase-fold protein [Flavobacterium bernardetii]MBC5836124.1 esterase [Flavobacterium bernardetii]NHF71309.1 esterase [Flavobacterium bernardetii]